MNPNVINGALRAIIPAVLAYAVGKGWISQDQVGALVAAISTLIAVAWSAVTNWEKNQGTDE